MRLKSILLITAIFFFSTNAYAVQFQLTNGDLITGNIIQENPGEYLVQTQAMGTVTLLKHFVENKIETGDVIDAVKAASADAEEAKLEKEKHWDGKIAGALSRTRGNTNTTELNGGMKLHYKVEKKHEFDFETNSYYSSSERKMNAQRYDALVRYAYSFGREKKAYHFFKAEADHDRFANIDSRYTPSTGLGYWVWDREDLKLLGEAAIGTTFTQYRTGEEDQSELVLIPRLYGEKALFKGSRLSQDIIAYPSLTETGEYRWKSDTQFTNPITEKLALKLNWINEYNSRPGANAKELDMRLTTGLEYSF